jgi:hypothetical protein
VQPVSRRGAKILDARGCVQLRESTPCGLREVGREALRNMTFEDKTRLVGSPTLDHRSPQGAL